MCTKGFEKERKQNEPKQNHKGSTNSCLSDKVHPNEPNQAIGIAWTLLVWRKSSKNQQEKGAGLTGTSPSLDLPEIILPMPRRARRNRSSIWHGPQLHEPWWREQPGAKGCEGKAGEGVLARRQWPEKTQRLPTIRCSFTSTSHRSLKGVLTALETLELYQPDPLWWQGETNLGPRGVKSQQRRFAAGRSAPWLVFLLTLTSMHFSSSVSLTSSCSSEGCRSCSPAGELQMIFLKERVCQAAAYPGAGTCSQQGKGRRHDRWSQQGTVVPPLLSPVKNKWGKNNKMKGQLCWPGAEGDICPHPSAISLTSRALFLVGSVFCHYSSLNCLTRTPVPAQGQRWEHGEREQVTTSSAQMHQ